MSINIRNIHYLLYKNIYIFVIINYVQKRIISTKMLFIVVIPDILLLTKIIGQCNKAQSSDVRIISCLMRFFC